MSEPTRVRGLRHWDTSQVVYQVAEIVHDRSYLQHGIEVGEGDVVLDVGANVGVAAAFFARECAAGVVHSFEPVPPLYELLRENVSELPACRTHPYGLAAHSGSAEITFYPDAASMSGLYADPERDLALIRRAMVNAGLSRDEAEARTGELRVERLTCELRTLSQVVRELEIDRIDLLKIDVEGAELDVLRGVDDRDWPRIRQVVAEVHDDSRVREASAELSRRGFEVARRQDELLAGTTAELLFARRS